MTLYDARTALNDARRHGRAIGAFNVIQLEHAEAIVSGAERADLPVILQISENTVTYHGSLEPIARASIALATGASVPVIVHLDHAESEALVDEALNMGFASVMFDGSKLPYDMNVARTLAVARRCRSAGASIEAELGEVGGKDGAHTAGVRTNPSKAAEFVHATEVDSLAVAVGTSHAMSDRSAVVDFDLIRQLAAAVSVPLVLHGSSGLDDEGLRLAVAAGMAKVNIATRLNQVMSEVVRARLAAAPEITDPRRYLGPAREAVAVEVAHLLSILAERSRSA